MTSLSKTYRTRAIITRGLYFFYPIFTAVYNQERLILQTTYVLKRGNSKKMLRFIIKSGFKSRAGYDGVRTVIIFIYLVVDIS